jgi:dihydrodipicolinate synthase/N-acetylneuraminate lyase
MKKTYSGQDAHGVFAVPPLARRADGEIDFAENQKITAHITRGAITRLIYGGNAFLYHITLSDYEQLLDWLSGFPDDWLCIPSIGPSFGRAMDQARLLRRYQFPLVMLLPCSDPRDARGLESGITRLADALQCPVMAYVKDEGNFGADRNAGLNALERLVSRGVCTAIKYAVVRPDPGQDSYLEDLLRRVDRNVVISGIGERPAVAHMRKWGLPGFTTGSGCVAPLLSNALHAACEAGDYAEAASLREAFLPLEDFRDQWGPARVLHAAFEAGGIAQTGPIPPFVSALENEQIASLSPVVSALLASMQTYAAGHAEAVSSAPR